MPKKQGDIDNQSLTSKNKQKLEVIWEFEADPDAAEKVRQAYEMLLSDLPEKPPVEEPVKKQGRLFSIKQLLGFRRKDEK